MLAVDLRHPDQATLDEMDRLFKVITQQVCQQCNVDYQIKDEWNSAAVTFDESCIEAVRSSVQDLKIDYEEMFSGAGHDSVYVSKVAPTSMIFIPCEEGISHNEAENTKPEDITAGVSGFIWRYLTVS